MANFFILARGKMKEEGENEGGGGEWEDLVTDSVTICERGLG
jgi:hypothetical protein